MDTSKMYGVSMSYSNSKYKIDGEVVDEETYYSFINKYKNNLKKCKPCYMKTYDKNDRLISEGHQYQDCYIGTWIEYHKNGRVKLTGNFKENKTKRWGNLWERGYCSDPEGTFIYYNESGEKTKTETYKDGKVIDSKSY